MYKKDDFSRKPYSGVMFEAQKKFNLDLKGSILIGDNASSFQAGLATNVDCNIHFAQENLTELTSTNYKRISTLRYALPLLNFGASQEVVQ
ncbi:hypothetical protein G6712_04170 [Polynucleobacter paneuropaeus]|nr:hypothetical protein [Polynucleobacter paneuropaeus]